MFDKLNAHLDKWDTIPFAVDTRVDDLDELDEKLDKWFARLEELIEELERDLADRSGAVVAPPD